MLPPVVPAQSMNIPDLTHGYIPPHIPGELLAHYGKYMETVNWRTIRRKVMKRAKGKCEICKERTTQVVHHTTYERLFFERVTDLLALCFTCHALCHPGNEMLAENTSKDALWEDGRKADPVYQPKKFEGRLKVKPHPPLPKPGERIEVKRKGPSN